MYKRILLIGFLLITVAAKAHNPDVSTTMLVENENGTWVLKVSSSLTAFQQEIRTHFSETPYKTPEEFQQMVLEHLKNHLHISFNDERVTFGKGVVKLGHETMVVFEVLDVPSEIHLVTVENTAFEDINRSRSALILLKEGFDREHFVLNKDNQHSLVLKAEGNKFVEAGKSEAGLFSSTNQIFIGLGIWLILSMVALYKLFEPIKIIMGRSA